MAFSSDDDCGMMGPLLHYPKSVTQFPTVLYQRCFFYFIALDNTGTMSILIYGEGFVKGLMQDYGLFHGLIAFVRTHYTLPNLSPLELEFQVEY